MVLRGEQLPLFGTVAPYPLEKNPPVRCCHPRAYPGLDAHYCPDCRRSITAGTAEYYRLVSPVGIAGHGLTLQSSREARTNG